MKEEITKAIESLSIAMETLDKACNNEQFYNTDLSGFLEQMSFETLRLRNDLRQLKHLYC